MLGGATTLGATHFGYFGYDSGRFHKIILGIEVGCILGGWVVTGD